MPRHRTNHHLNTLPQPPPQQQQAPLMQQQQHRGDPQVQRSQGVIFLSTNKPQTPAPQPQAPPLPAHTHLAHHVNQVPAHHASMFQPQHVPAFVPNSLIQNTISPFFPYYHTIQTPMVPTNMHDVYTPNAAGVTYDTSMQTPPSPIRSKPKRRSRYTADSDSDSSSDAGPVDDEEDPDWDPSGGGGGGGDDAPEPLFDNRRGAPRGRPRGASRGRGGGGRGRGSRGGGRGRGRGRGRVSDLGMYRAEVPPTLTDQTAQMNSQLTGRQTRNTLNMPSLDPQTGQMSFGELVSAAVQSLNDPADDYSTGMRKKQKSSFAAVIMTQPNKVIVIEKVPVCAPVSIFIPVDTSQQGNDKENVDELTLEVDDEDLIMAYEIIQHEDRQRPFLCEICGKESRSRVLHNRHLVTHAPTLPFACCVCSQLFENHEKLKPHLRIHHGSGIFVCPELDCEGVFQERKSLDDHDFACHPNARPFACRFCLDRFPSVADALAHEDAHDEEITSTCMKCSSTYKTKTDMKNHYSHMHEEKQCQFCEKKFENQPAIEEHLNEVHAEEMKPPPEPTPEPSPEPPAVADDDPMPSPDGGNDDDDILVVEEHKKTPLTKISKKNDSRKPKRPEPVAKSTPKPKPIIRSKPVSTSSDIITLSSDDEKDPEWKAPEEFGKRSKRTLPSPITRSTRKKAEYVIVVESRTDETAKDVLKKTSKGSNQPLTFVMGDSGDLVHVPTASDPHPPDSLPLKEIMDVIKRQKLVDNTTIVIEGNKISSVKPSDTPKRDKRSILSRSNISASKESSSERTVRPSLSSGSKRKSDILTDTKGLREHHVKPPNSVAKKRTGGIPRSDKNDNNSSSTSTLSSQDKNKKPVVQGPIAKKRTGGSSSVYEGMKNKQPDKGNDVDSTVKRLKQSRKESHHLRVDGIEPFIADHSRVVSSRPTVPPLKLTIKNSDSNTSINKSKRGRKRGKSKSERQKHAWDDDDNDNEEDKSWDEAEGSGSIVEYDQAPKRSLRIALKASVADAPGEESQSNEVDVVDPIGSDNYQVGELPNSNKKRGRPSVKSQLQSSTSSSAKRGSSSGLGESSASNGQVVMKALVNGKWQDVVIGTKLANDNSEPTPTSSYKASQSFMAPEKVPKRVNAKKNTGAGAGRRKTAAAPKITSSSRGSRRSAGRKPKNAKVSVDCWRDDRYQYFSEGNQSQQGSLNTSSNVYSDPHEVPYKDETNADYSLNQGYDDDTVMPFSLSSYMEYHPGQEESPQIAEHEDQGLPVIVNAYHLPDAGDEPNNYHDSYADDTAGVLYKDINQEVDYGDDVDELPLRDPLAMDDPPPEEPTEVDDDDPLGCSDPSPPPQPVAVVEPKKGTVQEAKSAISNLRSVLSQITFKR